MMLTRGIVAMVESVRSSPERILKFSDIKVLLCGDFNSLMDSGLLDSSCRHPIECSKILGGTCKNGICNCKSDHRRYNRHRCKPRHLKPWAEWHDK
ncbi:hypothetical protein G9C98_002870 [Cotesia typhae]|uniref:Uncharacterized protein n=1 Tax=Cotesia typhae TaxID=2053667 RepID=A0A8J5R4I7_9HYME|nr:hypothetical protein G9C98_002870 [Cotesia typhae]